MRGRTVIAMNEWGEKFRIYGPFQTTLSDLSFADYHMFRSQMRILTGGDDVAPLENHGDSSSTGAQSTSPKKP
jgi:hypothetical protein